MILAHLATTLSLSLSLKGTVQLICYLDFFVTAARYGSLYLIFARIASPTALIKSSSSASQVLEMAAPHTLLSSSSSSSSSSLPAAEKHWGMMLGGLISFKYLLPLPRTIAECVTGRPDGLFKTLRGCLRYQNDDVSGAAADLMKSFLFGLQRELRSFTSKDDTAKAVFVTGLLRPVSMYLQCFIDDLNESALRLDVLSCRVQALCGGFSTCCVMLQELMLIWPSVHIWTQGQSEGQSEGGGKVQSEGQSDATRTKSAISMAPTPLEESTGHSSRSLYSAVASAAYSATATRVSGSSTRDRSLTGSYEVYPSSLTGSDGKQCSSPLDVTVSLTGLLSELLLKLLLYCKESQHRCLLQLRSGASSLHHLPPTFSTSFPSYSLNLNLKLGLYSHCLHPLYPSYP